MRGVLAAALLLFMGGSAVAQTVQASAGGDRATFWMSFVSIILASVALIVSTLQYSLNRMRDKREHARAEEDRIPIVLVSAEQQEYRRFGLTFDIVNREISEVVLQKVTIVEPSKFEIYSNVPPPENGLPGWSAPNMRYEVHFHPKTLALGERQKAFASLRVPEDIGLPAASVATFELTFKLIDNNDTPVTLRRKCRLN
ncbi:hypothetical protein AB8A20_07930 [Tardiphaga sp. 604_B6_N1_1]|uniref:hypothetical protein n=1 Tax=unclassified Tardiphaga TaxID=2631404 RepID=UPI003F27BFF1